MAKPKNAGNLAIHVTFGGLCSFVRVKDDNGKDSRVHVMLVEARRSRVRKKLCRHDRFLVFRARDYRAHFGKRKPFFESLVSFFPAISESGSVVCKTGDPIEAGECHPETLCIWKIDGLDLKIDVPGKPIPDQIHFRTRHLLDLSPFGGGDVDTRWLDPNLRKNGLVATRFVLEQGVISDGLCTERAWSMCPESDPSCNQFSQRLSQTVECKINTDVVGDEIPVIITGRKDSGRTLSLQLEIGARVFVSNLCPATQPISNMERDVLAYYELCRNPLGQRLRRIPSFRDVTPQASACPPIQQGVGG